MLRTRWKRPVIVALALLLLLVLWLLLRPPALVETVQPQRREVVELVVATGRLQAQRQSDVGPQVSGTVEQVYVEEGDQVVAGEVVFTLERQDIQQQVRQAELAAQTARAQLTQVLSGPQQEEVAAARAELARVQRVNAAQLEAARQRLNRLEAGGRQAEIRRAEAELANAQASRELAQQELSRVRSLFNRGAISAAEVDRAQAAFDQARAAERAAREALALTRDPAASEDIRAARAEVEAARATYEESVRVARQNLERLLNLPRPEDVRIARARVREAEAAVSAARTELAKRVINAPISGIVTRRDVEPGQAVTPGARLLNIADMSRTEILVETDETNLPNLRVGQPATIIVPAYEDRPFQATVSRVGPEVDPERGVVTVRLQPETLPDYVRPDITVDANIEVRRIPDALAVPITSVVGIGRETYVLVVRGGVAEREDVTVLARGREWAGVSGISPDDNVVVQGTIVEPGQRVRVRR